MLKKTNKMEKILKRYPNKYRIHWH